MKQSEKIQCVVAEILTRFLFTRTHEEIIDVWEQIYKEFGLCDDPFTHTPCAPIEYEKNRLEFEKQSMLEKFDHFDGL